MNDANPSLKTTISAVIPLYQKRHRIESCLASVRNQTHPPVDVIVVDDGSTDGSGEIANEVGRGWIRYIRQENQGVSAARNLGLALAKGKYVAFLDADDTWRPDHLATLAKLAREFPDATILGTGWTERSQPVIDAALAATEQEVGLDLFLRRGALGRHMFATPAVAVRRECVSSIALFPLGSRIAEDQDAWITLLEMGRGARSQAITVDVFDDPVNPTMNAPRPQDFESVIFGKWSDQAKPRSRDFKTFVAAHRLFTIQRHIGYANTRFLLKRLFEGPSGWLSIKGAGVLLRMLLQSAGVLSYLKELRRRGVL